jgi:hypothetical protein
MMLWGLVLAVAVEAAADVHVHAVDGCVNADAVVEAFADDPIDVAELVTVSVLRNEAPDKPYRLSVTASLIGAGVRQHICLMSTVLTWPL